jgi:hypothetical protein
MASADRPDGPLASGNLLGTLQLLFDTNANMAQTMTSAPLDARR